MIDSLAFEIIDQYLSIKSLYILKLCGNKFAAQKHDRFLKSNLTSISAGDYHALGLTNDGFIIGWGENEYGQCNAPEEYQGSFISCSAAAYYSLGLTIEGKIISWGRHSQGDRHIGIKYPNVKFAAICAGTGFSLGLTYQGKILSGGQITPQKTNLANYQGQYIKCSIKDSIALGLTRDGKIISNRDTPEKMNEYQGSFINIASGYAHWYSYGLTKNGVLVRWMEKSWCTPKRIDKIIVNFSAGGFSCFLLLTNTGDILGNPSEYFTKYKFPSKYQGSFIDCYSSRSDKFSLGLTSNGHIIAVGKEKYCQVPPEYQGKFKCNPAMLFNV